jgi:hypothetical protein
MTEAATTAPAATPPAAPAPPATPAEAAAKLAELQANAEWSQKVVSKTDGYAEKKEFAGLMQLKSGSSDVDSIIDGTAVAPQIELLVDGKMSVRNQMQTASELRELGIEDHQIKRLLTGEPLSAADLKIVEQFKTTKLGDAEFVKRLLKGGAEEKRLLNLWTIYSIVGQQKQQAAP